MALPRAWGPKPASARPRPRGGQATMPKAPSTSSSSGAATHDANGLPIMPSAAQLRAKANAQVWKSVEQMMGQLPSTAALAAPYDAQRAAIAPLVDAHRAWLEQAGEYQVRMANGLAKVTGDAAATGDASQAGTTALAGGPAGATFEGNVTPAATSVVPAALGGSFANYLHALVPYATAQGIGNIGLVNKAQDQTLADLQEERRKIRAGVPDMIDKAFTGLSTNAFEQYKSELAAILANRTADQKDSAAATKADLDNRKLTIAARNATTAEKRASNALLLADRRGQSTQDTNARKLLQSSLTKAINIYNREGGVTVPGNPGGTTWQMQLKRFPPSTILNPKPAAKIINIYGTSQADMLAKAQAYKGSNPVETRGTGPTAVSGYYSDGTVKTINSTSSSSTKKDRPSAETRRLRAWRYLLAENSTLGANALSENALRNMFQSMLPKTTK